MGPNCNNTNYEVFKFYFFRSKVTCIKNLGFFNNRGFGFLAAFIVALQDISKWDLNGLKTERKSLFKAHKFSSDLTFS